MSDDARFREAEDRRPGPFDLLSPCSRAGQESGDDVISGKKTMILPSS